MKPFRKTAIVVATFGMFALANSLAEGKSGHPACDKYYVALPEGTTAPRLHSGYRFVPPRPIQGSAYACVLATIDQKGRVVEAKLQQTDRAEVGASATEQILKWHFSPAMRDGRPVSVTTVIVAGYGT
jgi:hypothetical protein